jgi:hypothetical protein
MIVNAVCIDVDSAPSACEKLVEIMLRLARIYHQF